MITLEQAKNLRYGQELIVDEAIKPKGSRTIRVAGAVKTWARDPDRIRIPVKYGLYATGYLTNGSWENGRRINLTLTEVSLAE